MTDREDAGLRNQVKFRFTELDYVYPDRQWVMHTKDTFSPLGHLIERRHRNPDGSQWSMVYRYDERWRLLEKEYVGEKPEDQQLYSYRYDPLGRIDRVILRSAQENERVFESVQYAADGTKTNTSYPTPLDATRGGTTLASVGSMLHLSIDAVVVMTLLDASDRPVRKVLYNVDDRVIRRVAFLYDARGLLLEEGEWIGGSIRDDFRNVYRYDASGRQVEADKRWGDLGGERRSFAYNERGDVIRETIEQHTGLMSEFMEPQAWTQRYAYQYDSYDNWIERTTETISNTGETRVSMIERRELTYH